MMSYLQWLRAMAELHKEAEFLLTDTSEMVSVGNQPIEFRVIEEAGHERLGRRSSRDFYRTRVFISNPDNVSGSKFEISENYVAALDKTIVASWGFSLHQMFLENHALFESAYQSLKQKVSVVAESSKALLEAAMGEKIVRLVAQRLQGANDVTGNIKTMLDEQIRDILLNEVMPEIKRVSQGTAITKLGFKVDANFSWQLENEDDDVDLNIVWKSLCYRFTGRTGSVYLMRQSVQDICVRDCFLLVINVAGLGEQIARTIERVSRLEN